MARIFFRFICSKTDLFALFSKSVAHTLDSNDVFVTYFTTQTADMNIDCTVTNNNLRAPNTAINFLSRKESVGLRKEQIEQCKFLARKHRFLTVAYHRMTLATDLDFALLNGFLNTPHYGIHTTLQQVHSYRFSQIIISTDIEASKLVILLAQSRQKHDVCIGHFGHLAQRFASLYSVHSRHHHIEQNQMRSTLGSNLQSLHSVGSGEDLIPLLREVISDKLQNIGFVINQEYSMRHIFVLFVRR